MEIKASKAGLRDEEPALLARGDAGWDQIRIF
jgi:hypothetical protein